MPQFENPFSPPVQIGTKLTDEKSCDKKQHKMLFYCSRHNILVSNGTKVLDIVDQNWCDFRFFDGKSYREYKNQKKVFSEKV